MPMPDPELDGEPVPEAFRPYPSSIACSNIAILSVAGWGGGLKAFKRCTNTRYMRAGRAESCAGGWIICPDSGCRTHCT
eukprot:6126009-Amphidinium_carterae.2